MRNAIFDPEEYVRKGGVSIDYDPTEMQLKRQQKKAGWIIVAIGILLGMFFWPIGIYLILVGLYAVRTEKMLIKEG